MHEMGIALQIMEIARSSLPTGSEDVRIEKVNLKIGKLAAVVPSSLRFCFEVVSKDTPFAGSTLDIKEVPVVVKCRSCRNEWTVIGPDFRCKTCPDGEVDIVTGREIEIISLEVAE
ncbi:MAG: hydrogenase maturation nickel metallochaperone HypA [Desulfobacterales bacterium]|nr:hydrogenase maturation nickel metallochaperone HypA [Desulfobacterales bacterium]